MGCCYIFNKPLIIDADLSDTSLTIDITTFSGMIPAFDSNTSGIWLPIVIKPDKTNLSKVDFLRQPDSSIYKTFDPTNCVPDNGIDYDSLEKDTTFSCEYCNYMKPLSYTASWQLKDTDNNLRTVLDLNNNDTYPYIVSDCSNGACDTRMKKDDYLPKIPVLNHNYLNKFYDFKYMQQFPATTNAGLGFDAFISINKLNSFSKSPKLLIDWNIKESISEIPYDPMNSPYDNIDQHNKAYIKSLTTSKTCGNFILTQINPDSSGILPDYPIFSGIINDYDTIRITQNILDLVPSVENFTQPYGFSSNTYDNIFIKKDKIGSHWKWNYSSGVLCWYRYFNKDAKDDRPIPGVDLYISPGDVFYAKNDGPEPPTISYADDMTIKPCPSGLKLVKDGNVTGVIPSGSDFTYISANIYPKFMNILAKINNAAALDENNISLFKKFNLAALLATAPEYDGVTVDLYKRNKTYDYIINNYFQISGINKDLLTGTEYGSIDQLNYIKSKKDLVRTLADKYGCYLWCPPNTTSSIELDKNVNSQCFVNLGFDMVALSGDIKAASVTGCSPTLDCSANTPSKIFSYSQKFELGNLTLESKLDTKTRYNTECKNATNTSIKSSRIAGLYANNSLLQEIAYNSGCYMFQDNYPRILSSGMSIDTCCNSSGINCNVCDEYSTYYLPNVNARKICFDYQGKYSFCDKPSAFTANNSDGPDVVGTRPARNIVNNSIYYKRSYSAVCFNPHISDVAFHHQGGMYYIGNNFGSLTGTTVFVKGVDKLFTDTTDNKLKISFNTKDAGIKIFNLKVEKIRGNSSDTHTCRAFPIKDKCKCYGLNAIASYPFECGGTSTITYTNNPVLYTPNISTQYGPKLKAYGGYSLNKINELLGGAEITNKILIIKKDIEGLNKTINFMKLSDLSIDKDGNKLSDLEQKVKDKEAELDGLTQALTEFRIPGHPEPEQALPSLLGYIDPLNPYGCEKSVIVNLNNYVHTSYSIKFPSYDTVHADIWAQVLENVSLFKPVIYSTNSDGEIISSINTGYQRYTTKVEINNTGIYDQQQKQITSKGTSLKSTQLTVSLTNPYLSALLGSEYTLHPPTGTFCKKNIFSTRGDETSSVNIKFSRIPRQQILNFYIKSPTPMGVLTKAFFHPNSGLIKLDSATNPTSPIVRNDKNELFIDYDKDIFKPEDKFSSDGMVMYGEITPTVQRIISQIGDFENHRKLRLYLKLSDGWYQYNPHNTFGFLGSNDKMCIGQPFVFEYLTDEKDKTAFGPWLPTSPKEHVQFNFVYNHPYSLSKTRQGSNLIQIRKNSSSPKEVFVPGSRPYFCVLETDNSVVSLSDTIEGLSSADQDLISLDRPELLLNNSDRYRYIGGEKNKKTSYVISDYNYLYTNFSDLFIDYNSKNKLGYVYNTRKTCDQNVLIINIDNPKKTYSTKIIEKSIYCIYVDSSGNKIKLTDTTTKKYIKIYTKFIFDKPLKYDNFYIDFNQLFTSLGNTDGIDSFVLFKNLDTIILKKESDYNLYNQYIQTKWGDLLDFNNDSLRNELTQYITNKDNITKIYPSSLYLNNFYKLVINNTNFSKHNFLLEFGNEKVKLSFDDPVYSMIHQKYNLGIDTYATESDFISTNNYLPFIDINILPLSGVDNTTTRTTLSTHISNYIGSTDKIFSGTMKISGIHKNLDVTHDWGDYISPKTNKYFWVNLDKNTKLESALSFVGSAGTGFYSSTLRIDDVPFQLQEVNYSRALDPGVSCAKQFAATIPTTSTTFAATLFDFQHFSFKQFDSDVFARYPIYCDPSNIDGCETKECILKTIGWDTFKAKYGIYQPKTKDIIKSNQINQAGSSIQDLTSIPYIISYDGGFYNPLGTSGISYIRRLELDPYNTLSNNVICDGSTTPRPAFNKYSILNEEYQSAMNSGIVNDHTTIVKDTDTIANEMFFRLVYGENQKINLERIDGSNTSIKLKDLLKYSDPRVEAKDIYRNIPYDLDIDSDSSNRKISGSISIHGILNLNKSVSVSIDKTNMSFKIEQDSNTGAINIKFNDGVSSSDIISKIYDTKNVSKSLVVSTSQTISPSTANETYTLLTKCEAREQLEINMEHKIVYATIKTQSCTKDDDGKYPIINATFPYWANESSQNGIGGVVNPGGKVCGFAECVYPVGGCATNDLPIYFETHEVCSYAEGNCSFKSCTNRGVGPIFLPPNSTEITRVISNNMKITGYNRGVWRLDQCHVGGGLTTLQNDGPNLDIGPVESLVTTRMVDDVMGISSNPQYPDTTCGICFSLDNTVKDWSNNSNYNNLGRDFPVQATSTSDACECKDFEYGYCQHSQDASCECSTVKKYEIYTDFDYTFEYCRHSISLKGHSRRLDSELKDPKLKSDPLPSICNQDAGKGTAFVYPDGQDPDLTINEECVWYYKTIKEAETYYIFEKASTSTNPAYAPTCSQLLCDINYDNHRITVVLGGSYNQSICIPVTIANDCPKLSVTVPDDSFSVVDSINSECSVCGADDNRAVISDTHPSWDLITETRTCVLGYLIDNNPNENGPVGDIGGCQTIGCNICALCPANSCVGNTTTTCGYGLCGKNQPDSFPWHVCVTKGGFNSECIKGNYRDAYRTTGYTGYPAVFGCDVPVTYALQTSNTSARDKYIAEWKKDMQQAHKNTVAYFIGNQQSNNVSDFIQNDNIYRTYNVSDIVEGIVPKSCSDVTYGTISYPGIKYRASLSDPILQDHTVNVTVAYYTYSYVRPRTIQDVLKGEENAKNCNSYATKCDNGLLRITSNYNTPNCADTPICYDTNTKKCRDNNYCCQTGKISQ